MALQLRAVGIQFADAVIHRNSGGGGGGEQSSAKLTSGLTAGQRQHQRRRGCWANGEVLSAVNERKDTAGQRGLRGAITDAIAGAITGAIGWDVCVQQGATQEDLTFNG